MKIAFLSIQRFYIKIGNVPLIIGDFLFKMAIFDRNFAYCFRKILKKYAYNVNQLSILVSYLYVLNQTTASDQRHHQPNCFRFIQGLSGFIIKITYLLYPLRNNILQIMYTLHNFCHFWQKNTFSLSYSRVSSIKPVVSIFLLFPNEIFEAKTSQFWPKTQFSWEK